MTEDMKALTLDQLNDIAGLSKNSHHIQNDFADSSSMH